MKFSSVNALFLTAYIGGILNAKSETFWCGGDPCIRPMRESCTEFLEQNVFLDGSTCCSLADGADMAGCILTVAFGSCSWEPRDYECDSDECASPPNVTMATRFVGPCPDSAYWPPSPTASPTASTTASQTFTPIGCFADRYKRDMVERLDDNLSIEECIMGCTALDYLYAGLQAGTHCFCDEDYGSYGTSNDCDTTCVSGEGICGGNWANSVYETGIGVEPMREDYVGCYSDNRRRTMDEQLDDGLSINECIQGCADRGYSFAGLQGGRQCFCGDDEYGSLGENENCVTPCRNGPGICGGNWANSVYRTGIPVDDAP